MASDEPEVDAEAEQQKEETEERQTAVLVVVTGHGDAKVELRHVAGDTVELLRLALEDQRDTCHLTNYTLSIRSSSEEGGERVVMQDAVVLNISVQSYTSAPVAFHFLTQLEGTLAGQAAARRAQIGHALGPQLGA